MYIIFVVFDKKPTLFLNLQRFIILCTKIVIYNNIYIFKIILQQIIIDDKIIQNLLKVFTQNILKNISLDLFFCIINIQYANYCQKL